jgi:hypothetical protein
MRKIIFSLFVCLFLFGSHAEGSRSTTVNLWLSDQHVIQGILPEEWRPLAAEELDTLISAIPERVIQQSGKIVSSFQFMSEDKREYFSHDPQIIVFAKTDEYVNQDMIQKTYAWLGKNENLLTGMLSDKVDKVGIQNIEYIQKLPAILFQNSLPANDRLLTGLSSIVFLKSSILNIVCLAEEKEFTGYENAFRSFIESIIIPPPLQHDTVIDSQSTTFLREFSALLDRKWQTFLGLFLIIGIYGWVFLTGKEKRV